MDQPVAATTDDALMLAWAAGEASAFEVLYGRHRGPLFRFLLAQLRDRPLAEELYQDVWQRVIAARATWRPEAAFATWLYRIAHNRLNDHWRAQRHRPPAPLDAELRTAALADPEHPGSVAEQHEQRQRLQQALDELPDEQREAVLLRLQQELSLEEIGRITGVGRETVKSRLRYALDKRYMHSCRDNFLRGALHDGRLEKRDIGANIWGFRKSQAEYRVYVTDAAGTRPRSRRRLGGWMIFSPLPVRIRLTRCRFTVPSSRTSPVISSSTSRLLWAPEPKRSAGSSAKVTTRGTSRSSTNTLR